MFSYQVNNHPLVGQIVTDHAAMESRIWTGSEWVSICDSALDESNIDILKQLLMDRKNMSNEWLESEYNDLKLLREQHEAEYNLLRDKYKVFEILKRVEE